MNHGAPDDTRWVHPAPATFAHQVAHAGGLYRRRAGTPEAEVTADGTILITLLRAVGWLARFDLRSRPIPAGPMMPVAGAQCPDRLPHDSRLRGLRSGSRPRRGARPVGCARRPGSRCSLRIGRCSPAPLGFVLSACKLAEMVWMGSSSGVLNPDRRAARTAELGSLFPVRTVTAVRLDEEPCAGDVRLRDGQVLFDVPARALRSLLLA